MRMDIRTVIKTQTANKNRKEADNLCTFITYKKKMQTIENASVKSGQSNKQSKE